MSLRQLVEAVFNEFTTQYNIKDFPTLCDVLAVISVESSWNAKADSGKARGLMQITESALGQMQNLYRTEMLERFGRVLNYDDMLDAEKNLWVGIRYLRWCYRQFENCYDVRHMAFRAYNAGPSRVRAWLSAVKPNHRDILATLPTETNNYVDLIDWFTEYWRRRK